MSTISKTSKTSKPTSLLWLRRDLRLSDQAALSAALEHSDQVIPVYIYSDAKMDQRGAASNWWLHYSLEAFDKSLNQKGSRLILRSGKPLEVLKSLLSETGATAIYANRLYEPELAARDQKLASQLPLELFKGNLLSEPWEAKTGAGGPYRVFTPYWKSRLLHLSPEEPLPAPPKLPPVPKSLKSEKLADLGLLPQIPWDLQMRKHWKIGEQAALAQLKSWLDQGIETYATTRNLPGMSGTSSLSPHLHFGEISPTQIFWELSQRNPDQADQRVFFSEIGWREFSHHILHHFPDTVTEPMDKRFKHFPWQTHSKALKAWQKGQTGYPIVDAGMRELWALGWMHNRVRMIVASFLTKDLLIPWQKGAEWFWDTLVDADLAANTFNWQWTAGSGADAAPFFRIFNPISQGEKFDPEGLYVRQWVPELAALPDKWLHRPWEAPEAVLAAAKIKLGQDYPLPIVDHADARHAALMAFQGIKGRKKETGLLD